MAEVPYSGLPNVGESAAATPGQNINAPASAFGANVIGAGLEDVAKAAGVTSEQLAAHAAQVQTLNNKSLSDTAYVGALQGIDGYAEQYKANNLGHAAADNLHTAFSDLEDLRAKAGGDLNPTARAMYDADSRRMLAYAQSNLTSFAVGERKKAQIGAFDAKVDALSSDSVLHPENFTANLATQGAVWASKDQALGVDPEVGAQQMRVRVGQEVSKVAMGMAGSGHPDAALAFVEQHREAMDGSVYAETLKQLHPAVQANQVAAIGTAAADYATAQIGANANSGYLGAVNSREGSGNNPRSSATGVGQFVDGTWLKLMHTDPAFAGVAAGKSDKELLALRQDSQIATQAITEYAKQNAEALKGAGFVPTNAYVGLAHGFGPQGAIDILRSNATTPIEQVVGAKVMAANPELKGKNTGQVVQEFGKRFGNATYGSSDTDTINGTPSSYELMAQMGTARAYAADQAQKLGGDELAQQRAADNAEVELRRRAEAQKATENQSFQSLASVINDNTIQDRAALFKAVPNGLQIYNSLPLAQRNELDGALKHNANDLTASREVNIEQLTGMYASRHQDPSFGNADISTMDLPLAAKNAWMLRQAEFKSKSAQTVDEGNILTHMLADPRVKPTLSALSITPSDNPQRYYQFLGALDGELKQEEGPNNTKLNDAQKMSAFNRAIARVATVSTPLSIGPLTLGSPQMQWTGPNISPETRTKAIAVLQKSGLPINEYNITRQAMHGPSPLEY